MYIIGKARVIPYSRLHTRRTRTVSSG